MTTTDKATLALMLERLDELARAFDHEATHYDSLDDAEPIARASASLRLIRTGLREGTFDILEGYTWLHAGKAVLRTTIYAREHDVTFSRAAVEAHA